MHDDLDLLPETKPLILIVDDIPKNLQVLGGILNKEEVKIAAATRGDQAISMAHEIHPDLILLDVMMPGLDGFETCRRLKSSPDTEEIPIIFLTAKTEAEDLVRGFEVGAVDYITKPFNASELLSRVHTHLELKRARDIHKELIRRLTESLEQVKKLTGLIPICASCKKIRDDEGYWLQVEEYLEAHSEAQFTHGMCPSCMKEMYPDVYKQMEASRAKREQDNRQD